jgi:hypothetical protein
VGKNPSGRWGPQSSHEDCSITAWLLLGIFPPSVSLPNSCMAQVCSQGRGHQAGYSAASGMWPAGALAAAHPAAAAVTTAAAAAAAAAEWGGGGTCHHRCSSLLLRCAEHAAAAEPWGLCDPASSRGPAHWVVRHRSQRDVEPGDQPDCVPVPPRWVGGSMGCCSVLWAVQLVVPVADLSQPQGSSADSLPWLLPPPHACAAELSCELAYEKIWSALSAPGARLSPEESAASEASLKNDVPDVSLFIALMHHFMDHGMQAPGSQDVASSPGGGSLLGGAASEASSGGGGSDDESPAAVALSQSLQDLVVTVRAGLDAGGVRRGGNDSCRTMTLRALPFAPLAFVILRPKHTR